MEGSARMNLEPNVAGYIYSGGNFETRAAILDQTRMHA